MAKLALVIVLALAVSSLGATIKIHRSLVKSLESKGTANVVVSFNGVTNALASIKSLSFASRGAKLNYVKDSLAAHAQAVQSRVLTSLSTSGLEYKSYWVSNKIFVHGASLAEVEKLATFPEVSEIREEKILHIIEGLDGYASDAAPRNEWGIVNIQAPDAWAMNYRGQGVVVGTIDTGARATHEALESNWRSEYGWFDPYNGIAAPNDLVGHGTHVAGTIAGKTQIGVAPDAQFIACKGCSTSSCTEEALTGCGEWMVCPTLPDGSAEDCNQAPHIVSNSWGGGQGDTFYNGVIEAWQGAGIIPVFAMGNAGPLCSTANSPGDQDGVIAVGSTTAANGCSSFSSKGPAVAGGSLEMKPDVCAPGTDIRSSYHTGDAAYYSMSGTSMATPHVSGVVALMLSANPDLTFDQVYSIITKNADTDLATTTVACDDTTVFPNEAYGHGKVNCLKVVQAALKYVK